MVYLTTLSVAQTLWRRMIKNNELQRMQKEVIVAYFKVLSRHLPGGTEENRRKHQSRQPVYGSRYDPGTISTRRRSTNYSVRFEGTWAS
jgi:hypothetical protein